MSAKDDVHVVSDATIDNATARAVIPVPRSWGMRDGRQRRQLQLPVDAGSPADGGSAVPRRSVIHRDCADRNDREKIPSFRKARDGPEFRRALKFLRGRVPSRFAKRYRW